MTEASLYLVGCPSEDCAKTIARVLVEKKLAACCFIGPAGTSFYNWEEKLEQAREWQLWIKSKKGLFTEITKEICHHHPFEVPQILSMSMENAYAPYLEWLRKETI